MQVFKACIKIIRHNLPAMMIFLGVFIAFVMMVTLFNPQAEAEDFTASRPRMAIINEDSGQPISDGLEEYLFSTAVPVELKDDSDSIQDALFFRDVVYILRIPAGFSESFIAGSDSINLIRTTLPDSYQGAYSDQLITRYLDAAARYITAAPDRDLNQTVSDIRSDLALKAEVTVSSHDVGNGFSSMIYYYIFLAYSLTAVMILGVSSIMMAFLHRDIRLRNLSSPVRITSYNLQLVLGNFFFSVIAAIILSLASLVFYQDFADLKRWLLLVVNTIVFAVTMMILSFLLSQFIRSRSTQQVAANVVALGTCFISGVFVPQEMLGESVLAAASFTPTYWYIRAVRMIQHMPANGSTELRNYSNSLLVQIAFAAAFLAVSLVISRQRRQSDRS